MDEVLVARPDSLYAWQYHTPAAVCVLLPNAPAEEPLAAIARGGTVVLSGGTVAADGAVLWYDPGLHSDVQGGHTDGLTCELIWWKSTGELDWSRSAMSSLTMLAGGMVSALYCPDWRDY
jgi:hypothetical protein